MDIKKKVGNKVRTKNQIRGSKSKGSQFEMSVRDSLIVKYPNMLLTKQEGYVTQYDLIDRTERICIECKKHKGFSWNEIEKYYYKLYEKAPVSYNCYVIFQANRQPCLVMGPSEIGLVVRKFIEVFDVPFIKHVGVKKNVDNVDVL